jgi:hypothetical protein
MNALLRSFLRLVLGLLCCPFGAAFGIGTYFDFERTQQNALNPGYPLHWSSAAAFPFSAVGPVQSDFEMMSSGGWLPMEFSSWDVTALWGDGMYSFGRKAVHASLFLSEPFAEYEVNEYFDPVETGRLSPYGANVAFGISPFPGIRFARTGAAVKILHEFDGVNRRTALAFDAGALVRTGWCDVGLSLRDAGVPFFRPAPASWLPMSLSAGAMKEFVLPLGFGVVKVLSSADAGLSSVRGLLGVHWLYTAIPEALIAVLGDAGLTFPVSAFDGVSPALFIESRGRTKWSVLYRFRWSSGPLHAFGLGCRWP